MSSVRSEYDGDQLGDVAAEGARVDVLAADLQGVEGAEDAVGVLRRAGRSSRSAIRSRVRRVELAEHAVVERGDHAAGQDAEVARVRVGVEEAEPEDLREQDPRTADRDRGRVDAQPPQALRGRSRRRRR